MKNKGKIIIIIALIALVVITLGMMVCGFGRYKEKIIDNQIFEKKINQVDLKNMIVGIKKGELFEPSVGREYAEYEIILKYEEKNYIAKCTLSESEPDVNVHFIEEIQEINDEYVANAIALGLVSNDTYEYIGRYTMTVQEKVLEIGKEVIRNKDNNKTYCVTQTNEKRSGYKYTKIESHEASEDEINNAKENSEGE